MRLCWNVRRTSLIQIDFIQRKCQLLAGTTSYRPPWFILLFKACGNMSRFVFLKGFLEERTLRLIHACQSDVITNDVILLLRLYWGEITFLPFVITFKLGLTFAPSMLNPVGVQLTHLRFQLCQPTTQWSWSYVWNHRHVMRCEFMPAVCVKHSLLHSSTTPRSANISKNLGPIPTPLVSKLKPD